MRKPFLISLIMIGSLMASAQTKILITTDESHSMTATLVDNDATRRLMALLADGPITIEMDDYGGFEKVGELLESLPTSNTQITTSPGDIMLYQGRNIVVFYGSNTWSYTPLGKIDDTYIPAIRETLGAGKVSVKISNLTTGIADVFNDCDAKDEVFDLNGQRRTDRPLSPGIYIINGKKILLQ